MRKSAISGSLAGLICLSSIAIASSVSAQGTRPTANPPNASPPIRPQSAAPVEEFTYEERQPYRPCPSSVVTPGGRHECVGCPGDCSRGSAVQDPE
jgi:hypothetical protein